MLENRSSYEAEEVEVGAVQNKCYCLLVSSLCMYESMSYTYSIVK